MDKVVSVGNQAFVAPVVEYLLGAGHGSTAYPVSKIGDNFPAWMLLTMHVDPNPGFDIQVSGYLVNTSTKQVLLDDTETGTSVYRKAAFIYGYPKLEVRLDSNFSFTFVWNIVLSDQEPDFAQFPHSP